MDSIRPSITVDYEAWCSQWKFHGTSCWTLSLTMAIFSWTPCRHCIKLPCFSYALYCLLFLDYYLMFFHDNHNHKWSLMRTQSWCSKYFTSRHRHKASRVPASAMPSWLAPAAAPVLWADDYPLWRIVGPHAHSALGKDFLTDWFPKWILCLPVSWRNPISVCNLSSVQLY